jgi:hypothetical protein
MLIVRPIRRGHTLAVTVHPNRLKRFRSGQVGRAREGTEASVDVLNTPARFSIVKLTERMVLDSGGNSQNGAGWESGARRVQ